MTNKLAIGNRQSKRIVAYEKRAWHLCPADCSLHYRLRGQPELFAADQFAKSRAADRRVWNLQYRARTRDHHWWDRVVRGFDDGAARRTAVDDADGVELWCGPGSAGLFGNSHGAVPGPRIADHASQHAAVYRDAVRAALLSRSCALHHRRQ